MNVKQYGAIGDGIHDDTASIQKALDENVYVYIPSGVYRITNTLLIGSHTELEAAPDARLYVCASYPKKRGDFLLSNRDTKNGNTDIFIHGGIWDGNFNGKNNTKNPDLFDPAACSGTLLNFTRVQNLRLYDMELCNSVVYFVRLCGIDGFHFARLLFSSKRLSFNQDGLHFGGDCKNGLVEDITASDGETNDDLIALNADDSMVRLENLDMWCGPIDNIEFRRLRAKNCYTIVRLLSVQSPITNIKFTDVVCGCRCYAINMDGARYCRTPLFLEEDYPKGCGHIENVSFQKFHVWYSGSSPRPRVLIEAKTSCRNFTITDFKRVYEKEKDASQVATLQAGLLVNTRLDLGKDGQTSTHLFPDKSVCFRSSEDFDALSLSTLE